MTNLETWLFRGPAEHQFYSQYKSLFGGFLYWFHNQSLFDTLIPHVAVLILAVFLARRCSAIGQYWLLFLGILINFMLSFRLSAAWDEFYINLKHSWVFRETGSYSYNLFNPAEATVDFLPYFLTGVLGKCGFPLEETVLCINLAGNALILICCQKIWKFLKAPEYIQDLGLMVISVFPALIYIGLTGFTAGLFTSVLLLGVFFFLSEKNLPAIIALSILPLIRVEGIIFNFFFWLILAYNKSKNSDSSAIKDKLIKSIYDGIILVTPFLSISIWRWLHFGSLLPNPVIYKNTHFDKRYAAKGMSQLWECLILYNLPIIFGLLIAFLTYRIFFRKKFQPSEVRTWSCLLACAGLTACYYMNGGDWFLLIWARYCQPFLILIWIIFISELSFITHSIRPRYAPYIVSSLLLFILLFNDRSACHSTYQDVKSIYNRWPRVERLAAFGQFLKESSLPQDIIASPEVATLMYFAERDLLDLLGVANQEIARSPITPIAGFADTMHMRRCPETVRRHRPQFIAYYGSENHVDFDPANISPGEMLDFVKKNSFNSNKPEILFFRVGPIQDLTALGYRHVSIFIGNYLFAYFVADDAWDRHYKKLHELGLISVGRGTIPIEIPQSIIQRFQN